MFAKHLEIHRFKRQHHWVESGYVLYLYMGHYQKMEESRKTKSLKISVKFFNLAATFIPNIHEGTNIQNMRSLTRRIIGQLIILCLLLRLKCQCSHKQTFYH